MLNRPIKLNALLYLSENNILKSVGPNIIKETANSMPRKKQNLTIVYASFNPLILDDENLDNLGNN